MRPSGIGVLDSGNDSSSDRVPHEGLDGIRRVGISTTRHVAGFRAEGLRFAQRRSLMLVSCDSHPRAREEEVASKAGDAIARARRTGTSGRGMSGGDPSEAKVSILSSDCYEAASIRPGVDPPAAAISLSRMASDLLIWSMFLKSDALNRPSGVARAFAMLVNRASRLVWSSESVN